MTKLHLASCLGTAGLARLGARSVDHVITDPPYSAHVHAQAMRGLTATRGKSEKNEIRARADLGFAPLTAADRRRAARHFARVARRWILVFCDVESSHLWRRDLERAGARYLRTGAWVKAGGAPQFSGDRPAVGFEAIVICHAGGGGRMRWNGRGRPAIWTVPTAIDRDRTGRNKRRHPTQKPLALMAALIRDFTDAGELVCDAYAGSGTTGVAAAELGRDFVGWEEKEIWHRIAMRRIASAREQLELTPLFRQRRRRPPRSAQGSLFAPPAPAPGPLEGQAA